MEGARPASWGKRCRNCSNNFQCPVWHTRDGTKCPGEGVWHPASRANIVQPDPARIKGPQNTRGRQTTLNKARVQFPCRATVSDKPCAHHYYKTAAPANKHMIKVHAKELEQKLFELYPRPVGSFMFTTRAARMHTVRTHTYYSQHARLPVNLKGVRRKESWSQMVVSGLEVPNESVSKAKMRRRKKRKRRKKNSKRRKKRVKRTTRMN